MKFFIAVRLILTVIMMTGRGSARPPARDYFNYMNRVNRHVDNSVANSEELSQQTGTDNDESEPNYADDTEDEQIDNAFLQTGAPVGTGLDLRTATKNKPIKPIQTNYVDDDDNGDEIAVKKKGINHRFFGGRGADPSSGLQFTP